MSPGAATHMEAVEEIARAPEEVFEFVADPRNDSKWCPRVLDCELTQGDRVAPGARFEARHHPSLKRPHTRTIDVLEMEPPRRIVTSQRDEVAEFTILYELEPHRGGTRIRQVDDIAWRIPRYQVPIARPIVRRHMRDQLAALKEVLEGGSA